MVVAPTDDIRIALMLAHAAPARIGHIIGLGSGFPILTTAQYQRMHAVGRFFRACARYTPATLPFITKAFRAIMMRYGIDGYFRATLRAIPGDGRAFAHREIADAVAAGFAYTFGTSLASESAFCAELVRFHQDWPPGLGDVGCPVTLIHGEQDGNAPFQTALEYCAMYPNGATSAFPTKASSSPTPAGRRCSTSSRKPSRTSSFIEGTPLHGRDGIFRAPLSFDRCPHLIPTGHRPFPIVA